MYSSKETHWQWTKTDNWKGIIHLHLQDMITNVHVKSDKCEYSFLKTKVTAGQWYHSFCSIYLRFFICLDICLQISNQISWQKSLQLHSPHKYIFQKNIILKSTQQCFIVWKPHVIVCPYAQWMQRPIAVALPLIETKKKHWRCDALSGSFYLTKQR